MARITAITLSHNDANERTVGETGNSRVLLSNGKPISFDGTSKRLPPSVKHPGYLTYLHYLRALALHLENVYGQPRSGLDGLLLESDLALNSCSKSLKTINPELVRTHLFKAWNTESYTYKSLDLHRDVHGTGAVLWSFVQLWYSISWAATPAIISANGFVPDNHQGMIGRLNDLALNRRLLPPPWNIYCEGDPSHPVFEQNIRDACEVKRPALSSVIEPSHDDCDAYVRTFIATTHKRRLQKKRDSWQKKNPNLKRFPSSERKHAINSLGETTLFHALYRLRDKSNYQNNDSFLWDMSRRNPSAEFIAPIKVIFPAILLPLEVLAAEVIGRDEYERLAWKYVEWAGPENSEYIWNRSELIVHR